MVVGFRSLLLCLAAFLAPALDVPLRSPL